MQNRFILLARNFSLACLLMFLASCASSPTIIANSDPSVDLSSYRTFAFFSPLTTDQNGVRSLTSSHLINATINELENAGLRQDENNPDLMIDFAITTQERVSSRSTPTSRSMPRSSFSRHGGRGGFNTWGSYRMTMTTTEITQTTQGTLVVDLVDLSMNQLVWEGRAEGRVTDSTRRNLQETLNNAIVDIFAEFP